MPLPVRRQAFVRAGRGPIAAAASQAAGLLQVALLLLHGGATNATDTYFYLFTAGLTPTLILVVGVMYPALLNGESISSKGLRRIRWACPALAALCAAAAFIWLSINREMSPGLYIIAAVMSANAALQSKLYYRAVAAEAGGDALWITGIALPANVAACIALALPWKDSLTATTAMVTALAVGNACCLAIMSRRRTGQHILDAVPGDLPPTRGSLWFFAKSSVGYTSQVLLSSLAVTLPASGVTVLSLANKLVGSVATTMTNAVMPTLVHRTTETMSSARLFLRLLVGTLTVCGIVATVVVRILDDKYVVVVGVISAWLITSSAAAVAQRTSFRFLPARAASSTMVAVVLIVAITVGLAMTPHFNVIVLVCAYAALDASTAALLLWRLRDRSASVAALAALAGLAIAATSTLA